MRAYGASKLTVVDRFGVYLSGRPIRSAVSRYRSPDVLDVGCGYEATLLRDLVPLIGSGVGIDSAISEGARATRKLCFIEGTAEEKLPTLEAASFDVVMVISVLEHLWEPLAALQACRRALRPRGTLIVNVPDWLGKEVLELALFRWKLGAAEAIDDHKTYYDKRDLWPLLVKSGFKPSQIRMKYHKFGLNLFALAQMP
jgi:SAM-dependent methyltransferase